MDAHHLKLRFRGTALDTVAAVLLGSVQRVVSRFEYLVDGLDVLAIQTGDSRAEGDHSRAGRSVRDTEPLDAGPHTFRRTDAATDALVWEDAEELLATVPVDHIPGASFA